MGVKTEVTFAKANHDANPMGYRHFKWELVKDGELINDGSHAAQGNRLSERYTRLGKSYTKFNVLDEQGKVIGKYFRYSRAIIKKRRMYMFRFGISGRGEIVLDLRFRKRKDEYTSHWSQTLEEIVEKCNKPMVQIIPTK